MESISRKEVYALGEERPAEFFRQVEALADSFDPVQVEKYEALMQAWIAPLPRVTPIIPACVDQVFVLSRVTLGADIKITSMMLDAMKRRFPQAGIALVANRKSAELFGADQRIEPMIADYPRSGPVSARVAFGYELRRKLEGPNRIVLDTDSRMTQLGLIPAADPAHYFHFPSRIAGGDTLQNLTSLANQWLKTIFEVDAQAYIAPLPVALKGDRPWAAVSLGVGENESKRIGGRFESDLLRALAGRYRTVWLDRGAGGEEARRVSAAAVGIKRVRFWEGSFAGFASLIAQSDFYAGYDSGGQHAAAAAGTAMVSIFAGAVSERFRHRWAPSGTGPCRVVSPLQLF